MRKWVLFIIVIGIPVGIGLGIWITLIYSTDQFITKEDAIKIARNYYFGNRNASAQVFADFLFLKYNGTKDSSPEYVVYHADPESKTIAEEIGSIIFGKSGPSSGEYFAEKHFDRFVWSVTFQEFIPSNNKHFIDAKTGELIGIWNPCPECVCYHNGLNN